MKKWNLLFLILFVILFIISVIPMFQWTNPTLQVYFFSRSVMKKFSSIYMPILLFWMTEWALLMLYIQSLFRDLKRQDATKFDLDK